ncbi:MAG: CCA tRNA nucleotidyltransferase [Brachyspira sp.]|nr:CCA tRNA nucleotidyltransferase [Brachyspira sp.]
MDIIKIKDTSNKLYYVGGVVRDEILGIKSFDVDMTYEGNAIEFAKNNLIKPDEQSNVQDTGCISQILQINEPFGTVRVKIEGREVDIASTRQEVYERKGHLPKVTKIGCTLKEDVMRRDFTVNTLAKSVSTGEIIDYTGGLEDIKTKTLRVLHDRSFIDDPTRILRALKFSIRFGFELDEHTKKLQDEYLQNINYDMCYKRIKKELIETFNLNSQKAFEKFINDGICKLITTTPAQLPNVNIEELVNKYKIEHPWIIYAGVLKDLSSLPLTKTEQKILDDFNAAGNPKTDFELYKTFEKVSIKTVILYAVLKDYEKAIHYLDNLRGIKISINGKDLQAIGLPPSAKYAAIFDKVLEQKLASPGINKSEELSIAQKFL